MFLRKAANFLLRKEANEPFEHDEDDRFEIENQSSFHLIKTTLRGEENRKNFSSASIEQEFPDSLLNTADDDDEEDNSQNDEEVAEELAHTWHEFFTTLIPPVGIGTMRDFTWAILARRNSNLFKGKMPVFWGTTLTQTALSTPALFLPAILGAIKYKINLDNSSISINQNRYEWVRKQFDSAVAASLAIPFWNGAQYIGNLFGEKLGLDPASAGYFSGVFTGSESWFQGLILKLLGQPVDLIETAFNTPGGTVWQLIFQANLPANLSFDTNMTLPEPLNLGDLTVGAEIAIGVALTTIVMTWCAQRAKQCCNKQRHAKYNQVIESDNDGPPLYLNTTLYEKGTSDTFEVFPIPEEEHKHPRTDLSRKTFITEASKNILFQPKTINETTKKTTKANQETLTDSTPQPWAQGQRYNAS